MGLPAYALSFFNVAATFFRESWAGVRMVASPPLKKMSPGKFTVTVPALGSAVVSNPAIGVTGLAGGGAGIGAGCGAIATGPVDAGGGVATIFWAWALCIA